MANIAKLTARLKEFEDGQRSNELSRLIWRPKEGTQSIRIVPYKFNADVPFIELQFYYNLGNKHYLAPCTFGKPDPIMEVIESLRASGTSEDIALAKKLAPTARTYAPIIVRKEEDQGVRYWGFGAQVYKQLLKLMTNPKYGDITSWTEGRDIDVEFKKASNKRNAQGDPLPETTILADPAVTPVVDPTRKDLLDKLKDQIDIMTLFPLKSYDELKQVVERYLQPNDAEAAEAVETATTPEEPVTTNAGTSESDYDNFFAKK